MEPVDNGIRDKVDIFCGDYNPNHYPERAVFRKPPQTHIVGVSDRQRKWDIRWLNACRFYSSWSKDPSTKCGAVIARDVNRQVSFGFNGYPAGVRDDETLNVREEKYERIIHAEVNALLFASGDLVGYTLYVYPLPPCARCAALICQAGISRVVTLDPANDELRDRWEESNRIAFDTFRQKNVQLDYYKLTDLA